jgi:Yip1 domain
MSSEAPAESGFLGTLVALWFEPRRAFEGIVHSARFWAPLVAHLALVVAFTGIWLQQVDPGEFIKTQLVESRRWDRMPPESREGVVTGSGGFFRTMAGVGALFGGLGFPLLVAGTLLFVFRFFYASDVSFSRALAITAWSLFATGLVSTPLGLLVMYLKGEWNLPPPDVFQGGPALLVERGDTPRPLWRLLQGLDFFSLWSVTLLAIGFAVASRRSTGSALWGVAVPWALLVLVRAALEAL